MLREIAALRTLAGTPVPHPGFIAGCDDLDVIGVVCYLMEEVDGFNPATTWTTRMCATRACVTMSGLSYAASLAQLGNVEWEGSPLAELKRPGSLWSARFRSSCGCSRAIGTTARARVAGA